MQSSTTNPSSRSTDIDPTPTTASHYTLVHRLLTWGVFVAIVLIGAFVVATHPVEYATSGAVVFTGSQTPFEREAATQQPVDPASQSVLSRFGDPTVVADMMARTFDSAAKQQELRDKGMKGRLVITTKTSIVSDTPDHGPVMVLTSYGADPAASSLTVTDSYMTNDKGWPSGQHVDGIQIGGAKNVTITHNTILNQPYGGTNGNTGYVSNSALGLWAELGNVSGSVTVDGNLLAGGGYVIYVEQKSPYSWQGPVRITNNTFDTRYSSTAGVWGPLYPRGLPSNLTWSGNSFSDGRAISQSSAINDF